MLLITCLFSLLLLCMIPFFCAFIQTIKNLIFFVALISIASLNFLLYFGVEFFPIFFILVYIGAIVVSTLFMVLTFDLRREYVRKSISKKGLFNAACYFFLTSLFFAGAVLADRLLWPYGAVDRFDVLAAYHQCKSSRYLSHNFCERAFGGDFHSKGLYQLMSNKTVDVGLISDNFYNEYVFLFLTLGIILTVALFAALTMIKGPARRG